MSRIVKSTSTPKLTLTIQTVFEDKSTTEKVLKVDDMVENLRYVDNGTIKFVSGRLSKIHYEIIKQSRNYKILSKFKSYFDTDVRPTMIEIDKSTTNHADVVEVPVRDILEDSGVLNVSRMKTFLSYGFSTVVELSDNTSTSFTLNEGQIANGITYLYAGNEAVVNAKVVAITYDSKLVPVNLETIVNNKICEIPVMAIKSIQGVTNKITSGESTALNNALTDVSIPNVFVESGTFEEPITVARDLVLSGAKAGVSATSTKRSKTDFSNETVISGKVSVSGTSEIKMDGIVLTDNALLSLGTASEASIKNCIVTALEPDAAKSFVVLTGTEPTKLNINGCYFGDNPTTSVGRFRNTLELNCLLKDGTVIANNYFTEGCATNNDICIYNVEDGATITIYNNVWAKSGNGIRIGPCGNKTCTINIRNNTWYDTDESDDGMWAGLVIVQPYGSVTTSMKNVTINIYDNNNLSTSDQVFYLYANRSDMRFTEDTVPTITVNGIVQDLSAFIERYSFND